MAADRRRLALCISGAVAPAAAPRPRKRRRSGSASSAATRHRASSGRSAGAADGAASAIQTSVNTKGSTAAAAVASTATAAAVSFASAAQRAEQELESVGFSCVSVFDASVSEIRAAVAAFVRTASPNDLLLVYYCGWVHPHDATLRLGSASSTGRRVRCVCHSVWCHTHMVGWGVCPPTRTPCPPFHHCHNESFISTRRVLPAH